MTTAREKHCDWCGKGLGYEARYHEFDHCGDRECARQVANMERAERDEARYAAEQDDYERYR